MKPYRILSLVNFVFAFCVFAQAGVGTNNTPIYTNAPVVTVVAALPNAYETGSSGAFRIQRNSTGGDGLMVWFSLRGTASNGVDYVEITNRTVLIPPGSNSVLVYVKPIDDSIAEPNEPVILRVEPSPLMSPLVQYFIGAPSAAVVTIFDNDTPPANRPPTVRITQPTNNAVFMAPANITIVAEPRDLDGTVVKVEFFAGTNSLGRITANPNTDGPQLPWQVTWSNVPPGTYMLRAKATDNLGAFGWSPIVYVTVRIQEAPRAIVSVNAVGDAAEGGTSGRFRILRGGETNVAFTVYYNLGGSASNGVDYATLPGSINLAAGVTSAEITVAPIDDSVVEPTESVVLSIIPPVCIAIFLPPPECYLIGTPGTAALFIRDNDVLPTNARPVVHIESPTNHAEFNAPADITITARVSDADGWVTMVEFFSGNTKLGAVPTSSAPGQSVMASFKWNGVGPGQYYLTARAIDNRGGSNYSTGVGISVRGTNTPQATNLPIVTVIATDAFAIEGPITNYFGTYPPPPIGGSNIIVTNWTTLRTNAWETNTATFVVRRSGNTNASLTVPYVLRGTASNGVDYLPLAGFVTIPSGARSARVVVSPIDDTLREGVETVVLRLVPSLLAIAPSYIIGRPSEAGAILIDNDVPRPPTRSLSDALFHLCKEATNGFIYRLECSTNLLDWMPIHTNVVTEGAVQFVDPEAPASPNRFYRVMPELTWPPE